MLRPITSRVGKLKELLVGDYIPDPAREAARQRTIALGICWIGATALIGFGIAAVIAGNAILAMIDLVVASLLLALSSQLRSHGEFLRSIRFGVAIAGALFFYLFATGGADGTGHLWYYVFPLVACALLGSNRGARATVILLSASILLLVGKAALSFQQDYPWPFTARFFGSMVVVFLFSYLTEHTRERSQAKLAATNRSLQSALTELIQTREELGESEAQYRHLVERASDGIALIEDGRLRFANPRIAEIVGVGVDDIIGQPFELFVREDERARLREIYRKRMNGEDVPPHYETFLLHDDGHDVCVEINARATFHSGHACDLVMVRDVSVRKQAEAELKRAQEAAEAASEAKSQFLAKMSHEIRTPMHGVLGMSDLLLSTALNERQQRFVDTVKSSANHLLGLIDDILDFSKIEAGAITLSSIEFDLRSLVEESVELVADEAYRKGIELACWIAPEVPERTLGDPHRLRQVLLNLLGNAIKFTERGEVLVEVLPPEGGEPSSMVRFEVCDTGVGIPATKQDEIFEVFAQADTSSARVHGGSGLGLAISKQLIQMMDGSIEFKPVAGGGSHFSFAVKLEEVASGPQRQHDEKLLDSVRVLIADRSATWRKILARHLEHHGADVEFAGSGREIQRALTLAVAAGMPFHVAIVENQLTSGSAVELAASIQSGRQYPELSIILLAPWFQIPEIGELEAAGLAGCLAKPVAEGELISKVLTALGRDEEVAQSSSVIDLPPDEIKFAGQVLLAEDNPVNQQVAMEMLQRMGFQVILAEDGLTALAAASESEFDLILMDCQMPHMDGFESARSIRQVETERRNESRDDIFLRVPIIALTANVTKGARRACLDAGMDDYLSKPFDQGQLAALLARWKTPISPSSSSVGDSDQLDGVAATFG